MKKNNLSMLALSLIALCFSMSLHAQSSQQDLDQVELTKQLIGTWSMETGEDSTTIMELIPFAKGYEMNYYEQAKGETYSAVKGNVGFTEKYQHVVISILGPNGTLIGDMGEFVSDTKMIMERFTADHKHVTASYELDFSIPDELTLILKWRGMKETWDDAVVTEATFTRLKK